MANCECHASFQMSGIAPYPIFPFSPTPGDADNTSTETTRF